MSQNSTKEEAIIGSPAKCRKRVYSGRVTLGSFLEEIQVPDVDELEEVFPLNRREKRGNASDTAEVARGSGK